MGFLREMFGSGLSANDPRVFIVEAMVAAIEADGEITPVEIKKLHEKLDTHELFSNLGQDAKNRLIDQAADAVQGAGGGRQRVEAIAKGLSSRAERVIAYSLACELAVADNDLAEVEIGYIEALQQALGLPDDEARDIFNSVRQKSAVLTIEERLQKMRDLIPRFIEAMVLLTLADGKVDNREIERIESVLGHIADTRSLSEEKLHDEVVAAFSRVSDRKPDDVIDGIAKVITKTQDRFWTMTYMMIVAVGDGRQDWQELGVLASVQKAFGFDSKTMDAAMKIASQFPDVRITGRAPV